MYRNKRNNDIKEAAMKADVRLWEIAERLGLSDAKLSIRLRKEFTQKEKEHILRVIQQIADARGRS